MDFGPSRRAKIKDDRFHLFDYDSDVGSHPLILPVVQVKNIEILNDTFEPSEFVKWDLTKSPWFIKRDWGKFS